MVQKFDLLTLKPCWVNIVFLRFSSWYGVQAPRPLRGQASMSKLIAVLQSFLTFLFIRLRSSGGVLRIIPTISFVFPDIGGRPSSKHFRSKSSVDTVDIRTSLK
jgi:hypothetical protein